MLDFEEALQRRPNDAGVVAAVEGLKQSDTDGPPITVGSVKFTGKGRVEKDCQTPYGVATVARHVYQGPQRGPTYCPPDRDARIVVTSTPRSARVISHKYAEFGPPPVRGDLREDHGRAVSRCLIQDAADAVAAAASAEQEGWSYTLPKSEEPTAAVAISLDGACLLMGEDGWREAMAGALASYDKTGGRQHTVSPAATPGYGKAKFLGRMGAEIVRAKARCPDAHYMGIADGAKGSWDVPGRHTAVQVADSWHAAGGLGKAAAAPYRGHPRTREEWLDDACHRPKHGPGGAEWVLKRPRTLARERPRARDDEDVQRAIAYLANPSGAGRMDYAAGVSSNEPIGSGVTEAACEVIVKRRLCGSGMKWTEEGAAVVPSSRALSSTQGRWGRSWSKVDRWGFPIAGRSAR